MIYGISSGAWITLGMFIMTIGAITVMGVVEHRRKQRG